jgi:hypothetical protein
MPNCQNIEQHNVHVLKPTSSKCFLSWFPPRLLHFLEVFFEYILYRQYSKIHNFFFLNSFCRATKQKHTLQK